jgi:hypothetical protein
MRIKLVPVSERVRTHPDQLRCVHRCMVREGVIERRVRCLTQSVEPSARRLSAGLSGITGGE